MVSLVLLFVISWELTTMMILGITPLLIYGFFFGRVMKRLQKKTQDKIAECSTIAEESFSNVRTVKAFSTEMEEAQSFNTANMFVYLLGKKKACHQGTFNGIAEFIIYGLMGLIMGVGAYLHSQNALSLGSITAFLLYLL